MWGRLADPGPHAPASVRKGTYVIETNSIAPCLSTFYALMVLNGVVSGTWFSCWSSHSYRSFGILNFQNLRFLSILAFNECSLDCYIGNKPMIIVHHLTYPSTVDGNRNATLTTGNAEAALANCILASPDFSLLKLPPL